MDNINAERRNYLNFNLLDIEPEDQLSVEDDEAWCIGFKKYFQFVNSNVKISHDGGGCNTESREYPQNKSDLVDKLYSEETSKDEAFKIIDMMQCLTLNPFADLPIERIWALVCSDLLID